MPDRCRAEGLSDLGSHMPDRFEADRQTGQSTDLPTHLDTERLIDIGPPARTV